MNGSHSQPCDAPSPYMHPADEAPEVRILVDLQACQSTPHRDRGIGRYALALVRAMACQLDGDELWVALNGALGNTVELVRTALGGALNPEQVVVWESIPGTRASDSANRARQLAAERLRATFLARLRPDVVCASSLFEGYLDDAIVTVEPDAVYTIASVLYDLIPMEFPDAYLADRGVRAWYEARLEHLKRADVLLGISEHTCGEASQRLGVPPERVADVRAAVASRFHPVAIGAADAQRLLAGFGIERRFLMYTGGFDFRKNMAGLVRAYASLPHALRCTCQLVLVCDAPDGARDGLLALARSLGLGEDELRLPGRVDDATLVRLYNLCHAFVFPSLSEGFGLPVLEAMACGAAVVGSDVSSIPEIIGRKDALFDPTDRTAIARALTTVLQDDAFRRSLQRGGLRQAQRFTWADCGRRALVALREAHTRRVRSRVRHAPPPRSGKPLLACITPLPPEHSGISDYCAELLPALAEHYRIEVVSDQSAVSDGWLRRHVPVRPYAWFERHAGRYDRILYQMGNGILHAEMLELLQRHPGTVVLHELFLSGIVSHLEWASKIPGYWTRGLYESHGYPALLDRASGTDPEEMLCRYPCSLGVIRAAEGIIVHSQFCCGLADDWFGAGTSRDWSVIPHLRRLPAPSDRMAARRRLGLAEEWVVCCFGILSPFKCDLEVLEGWFASSCARKADARLVFVGGAHDEAYARELRALITERHAEGRVRITGWVERETYLDYLAAADCAVQMRRASRGESSGTVLDCMAHALPVVVNAHGAFNELPADSVARIGDPFTAAELAQALDALAADPMRRQELGGRARKFCGARLDPARIAAQYRDALERAPAGFRRRAASLAASIASAAAAAPVALRPADLESIAVAMAANEGRRAGPRQLLVDVSELVRRDAGSGIQRVVKSVLRALLREPPPGYRVEPVQADPGGRYRCARDFTVRFLDLPDALPADAPVDVDAGDVFLGLDLALDEISANRARFDAMRRRGVMLYFIVYDQLPLLRADCFPPHAYGLFRAWMEAIASVADGLVCISRAVEDNVRRELDGLAVHRAGPLRLGHFHLGADLPAAPSGVELTAPQARCIAALQGATSLLIVGTIEPRKGHEQALDAFEQLWARGTEVKVVLVGKPGWMTDALVARIREHAENGRRLYWFEHASDAFLDRLYATCSALLAASEGEGFGLPLIEAAQHALPIVCRDLPVFREVAGDHAAYFSGTDASDLADAIDRWLRAYAQHAIPTSGSLAWLDWRQSTARLLDVVLGGHWSEPWVPRMRCWLPAHDPVARVEVGERVAGRIRAVGLSGMVFCARARELLPGDYRLRVLGRWLIRRGAFRVTVRDATSGSVMYTRDCSAPECGDADSLLDARIDLSRGHAAVDVQVDVAAETFVEMTGCDLTAMRDGPGLPNASGWTAATGATQRNAAAI